MNVAGPSRAHQSLEYEEELTRMIAQLDLTDIERLQAVYNGVVHRGDRLSDHEVAFTLLMQNAQEIAQFNADRELARRFAIERVEEPNLPLRPEIRVQPVVAPEPTIRNTTTQTWSEWAASFFFSIPGSSSSTPSNPGQAPTTVAPRSTGHDCVICQDPIFEPEVRAPCGHFYDIGCVTDLFQSATRDESLYPPRCCRQTIPFPRVRPHLTQALIAEFELKTREFGTLKRIYCATPTCSRFLGPLYEGFFSNVFACTSPTCTTATCGKCRGIYEGWSHSCTPDAETERMLTLSRASGWSRCPGCAQMIELNMGCYHMTCRCKTEFCYLCSARWKSCRCPQWDENRLLAAAERQVDAQLQPAHRGQPDVPLQQAPAVPRPALAADVARNQPIFLLREAIVAAPNPAPVQAPLPVPWMTCRAEAQAQALPAVVPPAVVPRRRTRRVEAPPAPLPFGALRAEAQAQAHPAAASPQRTHRAEAQTQAPPPAVPPRRTHRAEAQARRAPPPPVPPQRTRCAGAQAQAPPPATQPTTPQRTRCAEAQQTPSPAPPPPMLTRAPEPHPASAANTATTGEVRERMVREAVERLRTDHDCQHTTWKYQRGSGHCENCSADLPNYIYRCGDCQILSCGRCQQNRL